MNLSHRSQWRYHHWHFGLPRPSFVLGMNIYINLSLYLITDPVYPWGTAVSHQCYRPRSSASLISSSISWCPILVSLQGLVAQPYIYVFITKDLGFFHTNGFWVFRSVWWLILSSSAFGTPCTEGGWANWCAGIQPPKLFNKALGGCLEFGNDTVLTGLTPRAENYLLPAFNTQYITWVFIGCMGWGDFREKEDVGSTEISSESLGDVALFDLSI